MKRRYLAIALLTLAFPLAGNAQSNHASISKLQPNFSGETSQGNKYQVYVFQHRKSWSLLIDYGQEDIQSFGYDLKSDQISQNSELFTENLLAVVSTEMIKAKTFKKGRLISDMPINGKYKMKGTGKDVYESMVFLESGKKPTPWIVKAGATLLKPFTFLFESKLKKVDSTIQNSIKDTKDLLLLSKS
ncbi:hypothetical protein [Persicobacter diffluens]|uniref:Ribosome association toxin RatA n=1 Tax=Persicobacter diffluens TaxID=981 RepID=A0AAN4W2D9_9BACT|nr:hypothetical protein PEDI_39880 [Persicobacter diffluens]